MGVFAFAEGHLFEVKELVAVHAHTGFGHADDRPEGVGVVLDAEGRELVGGRVVLGNAAGEFGDGKDVVVRVGAVVELFVGVVGGLEAVGPVLVDVCAEDGAEVLEGFLRAQFVLQVVESGHVYEEVTVAVKGLAEDRIVMPEHSQIEGAVHQEQGLRPHQPLCQTMPVLRQIHKENHR